MARNRTFRPCSSSHSRSLRRRLRSRRCRSSGSQFVFRSPSSMRESLSDSGVSAWIVGRSRSGLGVLRFGFLRGNERPFLDFRRRRSSVSGVVSVMPTVLRPGLEVEEVIPSIELEQSLLPLADTLCNCVSCVVLFGPFIYRLQSSPCGIALRLADPRVDIPPIPRRDFYMLVGLGPLLTSCSNPAS